MREILGVKYYGVAEAAEMLGKNAKTILRMIEDGRLTANMQTKPYLIPEEAIKKFLDK